MTKNKLTEIADRLETDKGLNFREGHGFTEFYYDYFQRLKDTGEKVYILEIGVYWGDSLHMYNEFFDGNCEIYGIDIDLSQNKYQAPDNVHLFQLDANDKRQVDEFLNEIGDIKFDFILDDGSHNFEHQYHDFLWFHDRVKPDGKYILEDLHTWSWGYREDSPLYAMTFFEKPSILSDDEYHEFRDAIKYVNLFTHNNPKASHGNKTSSTAIITLNQKIN